MKAPPSEHILHLILKTLCSTFSRSAAEVANRCVAASNKMLAAENRVSFVPWIFKCLDNTFNRATAACKSHYASHYCMSRSMTAHLPQLHIMLECDLKVQQDCAFHLQPTLHWSATCCSSFPLLEQFKHALQRHKWISHWAEGKHAITKQGIHLR